jgi:hypothetical protein
MPNFDTRPYWNVVEDCFVEFHALSRREAKREVSDRQARLDRVPPGIDRDIIYHDEPFNLACKILGQDLPPDLYQERYLQILERHYPHMGARRTESSTTA